MMTGESKTRVFVRRWRGRWEEDVALLLDRAFPRQDLAGRPVVIKPNLVEARKPPVTTPVELVAAIVHWLQRNLPESDIVVAEGCAAREYDTFYAFDRLGYADLARRTGVRLVDCNEEPVVAVDLAGGLVWRRLYLPAMLFDCFLLSVPVLKAHSLAGVTLTLKNMMGCAPPSHYQRGGHWKKSAFHARIHEALFDLNRCRAPDFTVLDATVGMAEAHLWGPPCDPPPGLLAAGRDPVAMDAWGCRLLGRDPWQVGHLRLAHGVLGRIEPVGVEEVRGGGAGGRQRWARETEDA